jgi:hypothetical protein
MRDARNLQEIQLNINNENCSIDSFWLTEHGELYISVNQDDMKVNYQASKLVDLIMNQKPIQEDVKISTVHTTDI